MSYVVTLQSFAPPARADAVPFTKARIEESATATGTFTTIDTLNLSPLDADPEHPIPRDLTTLLATQAAGFYRVVWIDGAGHASVPSAPVQNLDELAGGVRPTIADVAAKLRARTKVTGGSELGTFTESTRPTADEVDSLIDEALDEVLGKVQTPQEGSDYERRVRGAVALYTAILVELSYFPEQVGANKSPAATYERLYDKRIKALIAEGETGEVQGEGGAGGDSPGDAAYTFPPGTTPLIGWGTRW